MYDNRKMEIWQAEIEKIGEKTAKNGKERVEIKVGMDTIYGMWYTILVKICNLIYGYFE